MNDDEKFDERIEEELKSLAGSKVHIDDNSRHWPFSRITDEGLSHLSFALVESVKYLAIAFAVSIGLICIGLSALIVILIKLGF